MRLDILTIRANLRLTHLEGADLSGAYLQGARNLTAEQLCAVCTLYQAQLDPSLAEQIRQQCPKLLEEPQEYAATQGGWPLFECAL
jgi:Pentapeptide repeats (8 copies)